MASSPEKVLTRHELSCLERHAIAAKNPDMLRLFYAAEERYYDRGKAKAISDSRATRMAAREEVYRVALR